MRAPSHCTLSISFKMEATWEGGNVDSVRPSVRPCVQVATRRAPPAGSSLRRVCAKNAQPSAHLRHLFFAPSLRCICAQHAQPSAHPWIVIEAGNFCKRFAKNNHQPLFEEFRETSQDMFGSHYQVYFPWDVCLNSSKSGMFSFFDLSASRLFFFRIWSISVPNVKIAFSEFEKQCYNFLF